MFSQVCVHRDGFLVPGLFLAPATRAFRKGVGYPGDICPAIRSGDHFGGRYAFYWSAVLLNDVK